MEQQRKDTGQLMKGAHSADRIRTVALIAHGGSGKTSLADAALFDAGAVTRIGKVDDGSSISDSRSR